MAIDKKNVKSALGSFGNGLLKTAVLVGDLGNMSRMTELENEIDKLQEEYAMLNERLDTSHRRETPYKK